LVAVMDDGLVVGADVPAGVDCCTGADPDGSLVALVEPEGEVGTFTAVCSVAIEVLFCVPLVPD
jgi:hypothetical protein